MGGLRGGREEGDLFWALRWDLIIKILNSTLNYVHISLLLLRIFLHFSDNGANSDTM